MNLGIADSAPIKEKIKAEINDYLYGLNSVGEIDYKTYSEGYDFLLKRIDDLMDSSDSCDGMGFVIYDKKQKLYYCGLRKWNNQLRHAKIYHSKKFVFDIIDDFKKELNDCSSKISKSPLSSIDDLIIRKITLSINDSYNLDEFVTVDDIRKIR